MSRRVLDLKTIMTFCLVCKTLLGLLAIIALIGVSDAAHQGPSRVTLEPDGGYTGIVVKISDEVNDEYCSEIIENFQVKKYFHINYDEGFFSLKSILG